MKDKYLLLSYFIITVLTYLAVGIVTHYIFKTKLLLLLITIILTELYFYIFLQKNFYIFKRLIINTIFISGFLLPYAYNQ